MSVCGGLAGREGGTEGIPPAPWKEGHWCSKATSVPSSSFCPSPSGWARTASPVPLEQMPRPPMCGRSSCRGFLHTHAPSLGVSSSRHAYPGSAPASRPASWVLLFSEAQTPALPLWSHFLWIPLWPALVHCPWPAPRENLVSTSPLSSLRMGPCNRQRKKQRWALPLFLPSFPSAQTLGDPPASCPFQAPRPFHLDLTPRLLPSSQECSLPPF